MLTEELLKKDATLQGLNTEQINAIVTMSKNDETASFGTRFGQLLSEIDEMVKGVTGQAKDTNEKTTDYVKRMLSKQKEAADILTVRLNESEKGKSELEDKLKSNGNLDSETKQQLITAKAEVETLKKQYNDLNAKHEQTIRDHEKNLFDMRVESEISAALSQLQFKQNFNADALNVLKSTAISQVKGMNPAYIDNGKGGSVLVFRDENGVVKNNPDNQLNPYTAKEMLSSILTTMGVIAETKKGGAGGHAGVPGGGSTIFGGAKSKTEALTNIESALFAKGMVRGTQQWDDAVQKTIADNLDAYNALPMQ